MKKLWQLEEALQSVKPFQEAKAQLEQYMTTPHLAAHAIYTAANSYNDIEGKYVLDLGTGTGMLAIACALMGASNVTGIDIDEDALEIALENISTCEVQDKVELLQIDAQSFEDIIKMRLNGTKNEPLVNDNSLIEKSSCSDSVTNTRRSNTRNHLFDTVILNPPFGTKIKGADMQFLKIATELTSNAVYSLHKTSTREFVTTKAIQWGFAVEVVAQMEFDLEKSMSFHKKASKPIKVDLIRLRRILSNKRIKIQEQNVRTNATQQAMRVISKKKKL